VPVKVDPPKAGHPKGGLLCRPTLTGTAAG